MSKKPLTDVTIIRNYFGLTGGGVNELKTLSAPERQELADMCIIDLLMYDSDCDAEALRAELVERGVAW